jgi:hypothetical protein
MDVDSNKHVLEENNGVKILGPVNAHQVQFGMVISVLQIHVKQVKFGMNL